MNSRIIGNADEFWRLRLTRVDTTGDFDFEWHDDILYREPRSRALGDVEQWHVEAVSTDDYDVMVRLGTFENRESAEGFFERAKLDLTEMTKNQFEECYLSADQEAAHPGAEDEDVLGRP